MAMVSYTREELEKMPDLTDWEYLRNLKDGDIVIDDDAPDVADLVARGLAKISRRPGRKDPAMKKVLTPIRLSPDVERALKSLGPNYTTQADRMLRGALIGIGALPA